MRSSHRAENSTQCAHTTPPPPAAARTGSTASPAPPVHFATNGTTGSGRPFRTPRSLCSTLGPYEGKYTVSHTYHTDLHPPQAKDRVRAFSTRPSLSHQPHTHTTTGGTWVGCNVATNELAWMDELVCPCQPAYQHSLVHTHAEWRTHLHSTVRFILLCSVLACGHAPTTFGRIAAACVPAVSTHLPRHRNTVRNKDFACSRLWTQ